MFFVFFCSFFSFRRCKILGDEAQKKNERQPTLKCWRVKIFNYRTCGEDLNCFHHHRARPNRLVSMSLSESVVRVFFFPSFVQSFWNRFFFALCCFSFCSLFIWFSAFFSCNFFRSFILFLSMFVISASLFIRLFDFYVSTLSVHAHETRFSHLV